MKKSIVFFVVVFIGIIFFTRCQKDDFKSSSLTPSELSSNDLTGLYSLQGNKSEYDKNIRKFAKALAKAMVNEELRKLIKEEALLKVDGDYDIIWKDFKQKKINTNGIETDMLEIIVDNTEDIEGKKDDIKKKKEELEFFGSTFKMLQISVPVNCNKWDHKSFEPVVVFLNSDYKETQEEVEAYNSKGDIIKLSNKITPEMPVIVVNLSERTDVEGNINPSRLETMSASIIGDGPVRPTNLAGVSSPVGNHLTWDYTGSINDLIYVEKNSGSGYATIATLEGDVMDFLDVNGLSNGNTYYYRIRSWSQAYSAYSTYSNAITVVFNPRPGAPSNFSSQNIWASQMFLTWTNTLPYSYNSNIIIKRRIIGQAADFATIATLPTTVNSYSDLSLSSEYPNNMYHYQIYYQTGTGDSDAAYDVEYCTQRSAGQPLYLNSILVPNLGDIESWVYGAPEFDISVATMTTTGSTPILLKSKFRYEPAHRNELALSGYDGVYNPQIAILSNWDKDFAQSVMSVNFVEYDGEWLSGSFTVTVGVKAPFKEKTAGIITANATGSVTLEFKSSDKDINTEFVYYWEKPIVWRDYSFGIRAQFGNVQEAILQNPNMVITW